MHTGSSPIGCAASNSRAIRSSWKSSPMSWGFSVRIDRHAFGSDRAGDEVLVHILPVQVGTTDRPVDVAVEVAVGPVDAAGIDRHSSGAGRAGDEVLVYVLPVQVGTADRPGDFAVGPVDV